MVFKSVIDARWRNAIHESAHIHAARLLLPDPRAGAFLYGGGGLALIAVSDPIASFEESIVIAGGPQAEFLTDWHAPPILGANTPHGVQDGHVGLHEILTRGEADAQSDLERLAEYARRTRPSKRRLLIRSICSAARGLVVEHAGEIVVTARILYTDGIAILRAADRNPMGTK